MFSFVFSLPFDASLWEITTAATTTTATAARAISRWDYSIVFKNHLIQADCTILIADILLLFLFRLCIQSILNSKSFSTPMPKETMQSDLLHLESVLTAHQKQVRRRRFGAGLRKHVRRNMLHQYSHL